MSHSQTYGFPPSKETSQYVCHSDIERHGHVSFVGASAEGAVLDAVHKMVVQTQRDNIHSIPTDCPQREKRNPHRAC